jgi:hypothetical protein
VLDELLAAGTEIEIVPVVIAERGVLEAVGPAARMVEDGDVRFDATLMDEPGKIGFGERGVMECWTWRY